MSIHKDNNDQVERIELVSNSKIVSIQTNAEGTDWSTLFHQLLQNKVHGFCFSAYEDGQKPGDVISERQIENRIAILKQHTNWIRSFSCIEGNEIIPQVAKKQNLKTLVGAWLSDDLEKNEVEIEALIQLAKNGMVDIAAVGNEVLYREELTLDQLLEYIDRVKKAIPEIPVGYVDAYYEFSTHPALVDACDVILCNCYPYREGCPFEYSLNHMNSMYHQALAAGRGKKVIITETGWPSNGNGLKGAIPTHEHALRYFVLTHLWAQENKIETFYFSSFDERWKVGPEGDVGAHWGIWDANGKLKH